MKKGITVVKSNVFSLSDSCPLDYTGVHCETKKDPCEDHCRNGAECTFEKGQPHCSCSQKFTGKMLNSLSIVTFIIFLDNTNQGKSNIVAKTCNKCVLSILVLFRISLSSVKYANIYDNK